MPPPATVFWKKEDENQVSYFMWPKDKKMCVRAYACTCNTRACVKVAGYREFSNSIKGTCI